MNIQINYLAELKEIPSEVARRLDKTTTKFATFKKDLLDTAFKIKEIEEEANFYEISECIGQLEDRIERLEDLKNHLESYKALLLNYSNLKKSKNDKQEILENFGPDSLLVKEPEEVNNNEEEEIG